MKRWSIGVGVVVLVWYGGVLYLLPKVSECGGSVMPELARGSLQSHASEVCNQRTRLGDRHGSWALQQMEGLRGFGNRYFVASLQSEGPSPTAVVVYPQHARIFRHNLIIRLAFWKWGVFTYPTFLLTGDGSFFRNDSTGFDARRPPTDAIFQEIGKTPDWSFERRLTLNPPCG